MIGFWQSLVKWGKEEPLKYGVRYCPAKELRNKLKSHALLNKVRGWSMDGLFKCSLIQRKGIEIAFYIFLFNIWRIVIFGIWREKIFGKWENDKYYKRTNEQILRLLDIFSNFYFGVRSLVDIRFREINFIDPIEFFA